MTEAAELSNSDRKRIDIANEAARLFDQHGFHSASMEEIAAAVGVRKPTLYHYFGSKDDILLHIHEDFIGILLDRQEARSGTGMSADVVLLEMMSDVLELMETHRGHVRVFFEHHRELPEETRVGILIKRRRYRQMLEDVLQQGIDEGRFRRVDTRLIALAIFGMVNWAYQWYRSDGPSSHREIAETFWRFAIRGLAAGSNAPGATT